MYTIQNNKDRYLALNEEGYEWTKDPKYPNSYFIEEEAFEWKVFFNSKGTAVFPETVDFEDGV